jgi:hypothetical protein
MWCWFGQVELHARNIELFSRFSGTFVGKLKKPDKSLSAFDQVRELQRQAFLLCGHPTRSLEDIVLYVHNVQVGPPNMPYLEDLGEEASLQVQSLLHGCTSLEMMYDESDEHAKQQVSNARISVGFFPEFVSIMIPSMSVVSGLPRELGYIAKQGHTQWSMYYMGVGSLQVDFTVFGMKYKQSKSGSLSCHVELLKLSKVIPTNYMHYNVKSLSVEVWYVDCKVFADLDQLEVLKLSEIAHLANHQANTQGTYIAHNFKALAGLPNLKHVHLNVNLVTLQSASELLDAMALMPHVTWSDNSYLGDVRVTLRNMQRDNAVPTYVRLVRNALGCVVVGVVVVVVGLTVLNARGII